MEVLSKILFSMKPQEIGRHFKTLSELYLNPLKIYKKVLANRKNGYEFVVFSIYYYGLFIFLLINNLLTTVQVVLLEILVTLVPLLIFLLPFSFFKRQFKKRIKWSSFFRLLLILKIQLVPIVGLIIILAKWSEVESLYILISNSIWIIWISFMVVLPVVINLKFWQKILWIFSNYICFLFFFLLIGFSIEIFTEFEKLTDKLAISTPSMEYLDFNIESSDATYFINDSLYLVVAKKVVVKNENLYIIERAQHVSNEIVLAFIITETNNLKKEIKTNMLENKRLKDSIGIQADTITFNKKFTSKELELYPEEEELTLKKLNLYDEILSKFVNTDKELAKEYLDSTKFEINRNYYKSLYDYLKKYEESFTEINKLAEIVDKSQVDKSLKIENKYVVMYKLKKEIYEPERTLLKHYKREIEKFSQKSNFLMDLILKPIEIIFY